MDDMADDDLRTLVREFRTSVSDDLSARITLRLPEGLKVRIETAASVEGVSVNAWIVRVLTRMASGARGPRVGSRLTGFGRS
jgi:predicted HicB family RNase H-like nuclease